jgi:hypothetical protein
MSERDPLTRLLGIAGQDSGCDAGMAVLAEYVELGLAGRDPEQLFPGLAAHLRNCPACAEDHEGLVALVRGREE